MKRSYSESVQHNDAQDPDAFAAVKEMLHTEFMRQTPQELRALAIRQTLSPLGAHEEVAQRVTMDHILCTEKVARYLCKGDGGLVRFKRDEADLDDSFGPTPAFSLFEPGKLPLKFVMAAVEHFRREKLLDSVYIECLLKSCLDYFTQLPSLLKISVPTEPPLSTDDGPTAKPRITVCGDTHGQFYDLLHIFEMNGYPHRTNPYVFNGDFVDRGKFSLEVILTLFLFKLYDPDCIHLIRGNHETQEMSYSYGFYKEIEKKYTEYNMLWDAFQDVFTWLPVAAVIETKVFVAHGGIPCDDKIMLEDIGAIERGTVKYEKKTPLEPSLMFDLLWSDPTEKAGAQRSWRGVTTQQFGPDITAAFLKRNKLDLLVRSHEVRQEGYAIEQNGLTITVFSAPNYRDSVGNKGAFIHFDKSLQPVFTQFDSVPHP